MTEIVPASVSGAVTEASDQLQEMTGAQFVQLVLDLAAAGMRLRNLSERVRTTYSYVDGCASSVHRMAEQMAGLEVDAATVSEHHEAAGVMTAALEVAEAMASSSEDLAALFQQASDAHRTEYEPVYEAVQAMETPMADASFYSNR